LKATAATDNGFFAWTGDIFDLGDSIDIDNGNYSINAEFYSNSTPFWTLTSDKEGPGDILLSLNGDLWAVLPNGTKDIPKTYTSVELDVSPSDSFIAWKGNLAGNVGRKTLTMNGDKTITAVFSSNKDADRTLTVTVEGSGKVQWTLDPLGEWADISSSATITLSDGISVTLRAVPDEDAFSHWSGSLTGDVEQQTLTMDGNKTVTAVFGAEGWTPELIWWLLMLLVGITIFFIISWRWSRPIITGFVRHEGEGLAGVRVAYKATNPKNGKVKEGRVRTNRKGGYTIYVAMNSTVEILSVTKEGYDVSYDLPTLEIEEKITEVDYEM
jgi:hypothetical protein